MSQKLLRALPDIYDAAISDDKWTKALDSIANTVGSQGSVIMAFDLVGNPYQINAWSSIYTEPLILEYYDRFYEAEEAQLPLIQQLPEQTVYRDIDCYPETEDIQKRPEVVYLREKLGIIHRAAACLNKNKGWCDVLTIQVDRPWDQVNQETWNQFQATMPHVAKVVQINRTFSLLHAKYRATLSALDHLSIGMFIALQDGHILVVNKEADRIFRSNDGVTLGQDKKLKFRDSDLALAVDKAIEITAQTAAGENQTNEVSLACKRPSNKSSFLIEICPLRDSRNEIEKNMRGSLVCIMDPDNVHAVSTDNIAKLYKLTTTESEICKKLVEGKSAGQVADERNVALETVRTQIKNVYAKLDVSNRIELVKKAVNVSPPIT